MTQPEMTCADAEPLLPLVAEGALDPGSEPGLFAHLARCAHCQHEVARHDLVTIALETACRPQRQPSARIVRFPRWMALAAALVVVAGAVGWIMASSRSAVVAPAIAVADADAVEPSESEGVVAPARAEPGDAEVVARMLPDGQMGWLVKQGERWILISPAHVDGAVGGAGGSDARPVGLPARGQ